MSMHYTYIVSIAFDSAVIGYLSAILINIDVVSHHILPIFTGLGRCPIVNWDFAGAVSIFGPDALPVIHQ